MGFVSYTEDIYERYISNIRKTINYLNNSATISSKNSIKIAALLSDCEQEMTKLLELTTNPEVNLSKKIINVENQNTKLVNEIKQLKKENSTLKKTIRSIKEENSILLSLKTNPEEVLKKYDK